MAEGKKLSDRALEVLQLIDDYTKWEGDERPGDKMTQFFVPSPNDMWCPTLHKFIDVHGSGVASALTCLALRRLTKAQTVQAYSYSITENGLAALADHWQDIERLKEKS